MPQSLNHYSFGIKKPFILFMGLLSAFSFSFAQNAIVTENQLPGSPISQWGVNSSTDFRNANLNGYATDISVNQGSTVHFKVDDEVAGDSYTMNIYRIGYYGGMGACLKASLGTITGIHQPAGIANAATGLLDCSNWSETASWTVPSNAVSGIYIVKLQSTTTSNINNIVFVVRNDASTSNIFFQTNDATWQAYNGYGGSNLYNGVTNYPNGHAVEVSYNRPFFIYNSNFDTDGRGSDWYMNDVYPLVRWLERNGYDISYTTSVDAVRAANLILNHKIYLSQGHDEYWSKEQRNAVETARGAGVNLAFLSGNEVYWKTRWLPDTNGVANRILVCYKEGTLANGTFGGGAEATCGTKCDPNPTVWTGLWRMGAAYDAPLPENALTGEISWDQPPSSTSYSGPIMVPDTYKNLRFWRNTSIAVLPAGQSATLSTNSLGFEFDYEQYPTSYPNGRITLSSTTATDGNVHKLSLYRYGGTGGPLVFGAGTIQWAWGLDGSHFNGTTVVSQDLQQATVNLFADMGVQPGSLQSGLTAATASTDLTPPVSIISAPANGTSIPIGSTITITGTASDVGGTVAGVQVSVDGGNTWQVASGMASWTFSWTPINQGSYTIKSRSYDDSGNMEATGSSGSNVVNITLTPPACPCHIFTGQTPAGSTVNNGHALDLGVKFQSSSAGFITGVRFYKTSGNTGTHIGELYSSGGTRLAQATFTSETATGWQSVTFSSPVAITANTTYIASYFTSAGNYVSTDSYFTTAVVNSPLTGLADGTSGNNGLYAITTTPAVPNTPWQQSNYWVDVTFIYTTTLTANAGPNQTITLPTSSVTLDGSSSTGTVTSYLWTYVSGPNTPTIVTPGAVSTSVTGLTQGTYVFQLSLNAGASTSQVTITVNPAPPPTANAGTNQTIALPTSSVTLDGSASSGIISSYTWTNVSGPNTPVITSPNTVTTTVTGLIQGTYVFQLSVNSGVSTSQVTVNVLPPGTMSIFTTQTPSGSTTNDGHALELGVKFRSSVAGYITGVRFYKTSGNTGTHIGELYSSSGTRLAQATFSGETATGWQTVLFNTPVSIAANTTYIASYFTSLGNYIGTNNYFTSALVNSPLTALADGTDGNNGLYAITTTPTVPNSAWEQSNYWVDVVFSSAPVTPTANAGPNQTITLPTSSVTFNGSGSTGTITSYSWTWISGPNTPVITTPTAVNTTVTGLIQGSYVFQLSLNGGVSTSQVTITVNPAPPPTANAGPNQTITLPTSSVTLNGSGSTGIITDYTWIWISGPNTPVITTPTAVSTTVTGLIQGTYVFQLSVNSIASTSQVTITVNPAPPPTANAGPNQTITLPTSSVTLNGSGSTGIITDYTWTWISGPNTPVITTPTAVSTTVTGLIQGTYVFQLSVNSGASTSQVTITVNPAVSSTTIFTTQTPPGGTQNDGNAIELGVKFRSSAAGFITGVRFYKTSGNAGTHTGELYSSTGTRLAQATFTGETATGWQAVTFSSPVAIVANTTYVAAYFSSAGNYTGTPNYFTTAVVNSPLTGLADGTDGRNGVYIYTTTPAFPSNSPGNEPNYWVDAIFSSSNGQSSQPSLVQQTTTIDTLGLSGESSTDKLIYSLGQNIPNPVYQGSTRIYYSIPVNTAVSLTLYDMQGRQIRILVNEFKNKGSYFYDMNSSVLAKGIYIYRMNAGNYMALKKMVIQ
jgi:hypothetical protein